MTEIESELEVPNCDGCGEKLSTIDTQRKEIMDLKKEIDTQNKTISTFSKLGKQILDAIPKTTP